jgi:predicted HicB family RNase H-like nuclease
VGLKDMIRDTVEDMLANGERPPEALADKKFSGTLSLRLPPEVHRRLAIEAAESRISLSRYLNSKLMA